MGRTPAGIVILSILFFIGGLLSIFNSFVEWLAVSYITTLFSISYSQEIQILIYLSLIISAITGILLLLTGFGFLKLKKWSWKLGIITLIVIIFTNLLFLVISPKELQSDLEFIGKIIASTIYSIIILIYLNTSKVKSYFRIDYISPDTDRPRDKDIRGTDRTTFNIKTSSNDIQTVQNKINNWIEQNKGIMLTANSDGSPLPICMGITAHPKKNTMVIKFKKGTAIIFELELYKDLDQIIIKGEGYVPQMGLFELNLDSSSVFGGVPRRKGYKLIQQLQLYFSQSN